MRRGATMNLSRSLTFTLLIASGASLIVHGPPALSARGAQRLTCRTPTPSAAVAAPLSLPSPPPLVAAPKTNAISRALTGFWFVFTSILILILSYVPLLPLTLYGMFFDNDRRRGVDVVVQSWARLSLFVLGAKVEVVGAEHLPPQSEPIMICPNHGSYLDIFTLSANMPRRFKYISKIEVLNIPLIGWAMRFARHIAIRRGDRRSQLQTFKDAVDSLQAGNWVVAFPEGTRAKDGRVLPFSKGPFSMAQKAQARILPVSIVGTHVFQPTTALVPLAPPRGMRIVIHPPQDAPAPKTEGAAMLACRAAVLSGLPPEMQPLDDDAEPAK
tara:strand:+ start:86 stop:1069 length:984 start_codon:yes stop_codon:yes gene_type:complete